MNRMEATLPELMSMLIQTKKELLKNKAIVLSHVLEVSKSSKRGKKRKTDKDDSKNRNTKPKKNDW